MTDVLFNKKHLTEYVLYGSIAGSFHVVTVWYFLSGSAYDKAPILFIGSIFFMFAIMVYAMKLTKRRPDNSSTWGMLISGQMAVFVGIAVSVIGSLILCGIYLPGFTKYSSTITTFQSAPIGQGVNNVGSIELIFITAIFENYGAGGFISAMIAYAVKPDQTEDLTPGIFEESLAEELSSSVETGKMINSLSERIIDDHPSIPVENA